jgi:hypothetical protein
MWLPCVDKVSERCMWDMIFILPQKMTFSEDDVYDESTNDVFQEGENTVICSGEIMEQASRANMAAIYIYISLPVISCMSFTDYTSH